jgi:hypothetical protein
MSNVSIPNRLRAPLRPVDTACTLYSVALVPPVYSAGNQRMRAELANMKNVPCEGESDSTRLQFLAATNWIVPGCARICFNYVEFGSDKFGIGTLSGETSALCHPRNYCRPFSCIGTTTRPLQEPVVACGHYKCRLYFDILGNFRL